jgi:hypothetical protein
VLRRERCTQSEITDRGTKIICLWPYRRLLCLQKLHRLREARKRTAYGLCRAIKQLGRVSRYLTLNDQVTERQFFSESGTYIHRLRMNVGKVRHNIIPFLCSEHSSIVEVRWDNISQFFNVPRGSCDRL